MLSLIMFLPIDGITACDSNGRYVTNCNLFYFDSEMLRDLYAYLFLLLDSYCTIRKIPMSLMSVQTRFSLENALLNRQLQRNCPSLLKKCQLEELVEG